jgi:hypothetical protein
MEAVVVGRNAIKHNQELSRTDRDLAHVGLNWIEDAMRAA